MKLSELSDRIAAGDTDLNRRQGTLIVDEQNRLAGIITRGDIVRALRRNHSGKDDRGRSRQHRSCGRIS